MDNTNNQHNVFNKLPASILSTVFVLAQNPQLSLLNKNMYKASQKVETVSDYIVQYVSSDTGDSSQWNLRGIFDKYKRISMNETIGMLVLRKIKSLDYETALDIAFEYRWKNMLDKLLKMYVVIDRNTSTVVHKGTLFMDKDEYLDIDIGKLFSEDNESQIKKIDIKTSNSLYIRPLFKMGEVSEKLIWAMYTISGERDIEMLIDICNTKLEFPPEICGSVGREVRCIDDKFLVSCILIAACESCKLNNLDFLTRILDLETGKNLPFQELNSSVNAKGSAIDDSFKDFVYTYGYGVKTNLLIYTICAYYSIEWDRKEFVSYIEDNYSGSKHAQIIFDLAVFHRRESLLKKYIFKVQTSSENIKKITEMACRFGSVDLIRFLINNSDRLEEDLDENALKIAIKKNNHELIQEIISKYPNTMSFSCLEDAVNTRDVKILKLLIEAGADLKSPAFKGILIASENKDTDMLRFLLEHGASIDLRTTQGVQELCRIKSRDMIDCLLAVLNEGRIELNESETQGNVGINLKFNKTILFLIGAGQDYNQDHSGRHVEVEDVFGHLDLHEKLMVIMNSRRTDMPNVSSIYLANLAAHSHDKNITSICNGRLLEIICYIAQNKLQNTLKDFKYDGAINVKHIQQNIMLNDRHYELAKSELVNRNFEILKLLIEYGVDINSYDSLILRTAYKAGDISWIDYFISKGAKLNGESDGFEEACKSDKVEVLEHWIKNGGVVPNNPKYECINVACILGNFDMIKLLVENGVDLSDPKRNGVRIACRLGLKRTLKYLLEHNAVIKGVRHHQLEYACMTENIESVKMILDHHDGLGVLERNDNIYTKEGEESQDISYLDSENTDRSEEYEITKILLENGEPIQNSDLLDAVMAAARINNIKILKILLIYKIDLNGDSKIMDDAVLMGNVEAVKFLLENGVTINDKPHLVEIAFRSKNQEIISVLMQHCTKFEGHDHIRMNFLFRLMLMR